MDKKLFGDCDNADDISKIEIDEAFARRYEHNKRREDLHRFQELKKKGIVDDSDDSDTEFDDDEDDLELLGDNDDSFFYALLKVKKQDPLIKEEGANLFPDDEDKEGASEEDENEAERDKKEKKGKKPMHLKDVHAKNLIEYGADYDQEGDEMVGPKSYVDEQEALKRAFLNEAEKVDDEDEDGPLLKEKAGNDEDDDTDGDNDQNDETVKKPIVEYFGADEELDENAMYLKKFFLNKMWIDKDKGKKVLEDDIEKVSDEEEEVDMQEDYEREYNFRYQENTGDRVLSHSRKTEDSVRKKSNPRKVQRQNKADRMASAKLEREEELKHLKNLKKEEFLLKLKKVKDVAGISDECNFMLDKEDLEEEFDPKKHDRKMKAMFNDGYYNSMDAKPDFCSDDEEEDEDLKKPDFDEEDILLGLPEGWDKEEKDVDDEEEMAHEERAEGKRKRKRKPSLLEKVALDDELDEKQKKELKEELYKLDYEGTVGDLNTRFPYRKVKPKRFGLSGKEILLMDDWELNQYVSIKKIAPYVENEYKVPRIKRYEQKMKNKELLEGGKVGKKVGKGKKSFKDEAQTSFSGKDGLEKVEEKVQEEKSNGDTDKVSRQSKRRRQQQELKLSNSRKAAYGTVEAPKSGKKSKHRT